MKRGRELREAPIPESDFTIRSSLLWRSVGILSGARAPSYEGDHMLARDAENDWEVCAERIRTESGFSPWLKHHLRSALARPPHEALEQAQILRAILLGRLGSHSCGDPLADVPLPARDPLATPDEPLRRRQLGPRLCSGTALLREILSLPAAPSDLLLLYLDGDHRVVARDVVRPDDDAAGRPLGPLFARALRNGACSLVLVYCAALESTDSCAASLLRKRVVEIAALLGVPVVDEVEHALAVDV